MKIKSFFLLTAVALLTFCGILSSCKSESSEILDKIPADMTMTMKFDAKFWVEQSGITFSTDGIELPDYLKSSFEDVAPDKLAKLAEFEKVVDLTNTYVIGSVTNKSFFIVAPVTDSSKLDKFIEENNDVCEDYKDFKLVDDKVILSGDLLWIANSGNLKKDADYLADMYAAAAKAPLSKVKAASEALAADYPLTMAMNYGSYSDAIGKISSVKIPEMFKNVWVTGYVKTEGSAVTANYGMVNSDGSPLDVPQVDEIDASVLNYVPADFNLVAAAGKPAEEAIDSMMKSLAMIPDIQSFLPIAEAYLKAVDGTTLIAAGADYPSFYANPGFDNWNALVMIHMEQTTLNLSVAQIIQLANGAGLGEVKEVKDGLYSINADGRTFYVGNVDGYLTLSTILPSDNNSNPLAKYLIGHQHGLALSVPKLNEVLSPKFAYPMLFTLQSEPETRVKMEFKFEDSTDNFVTTLLKMVQE